MNSATTTKTQLQPQPQPQTQPTTTKMVRLPRSSRTLILGRHHPLEQYVWIVDREAGHNDPDFTPNWAMYEDALRRRFRRLRAADPRLKPLIGEVHIGRCAKVYKELVPSGEALCVQCFVVEDATAEAEHARTMELVDELWGRVGPRPRAADDPDADPGADSETETVIVPLDVQRLRIGE